jgi:hypothetical protein
VIKMLITLPKCQLPLNVFALYFSLGFETFSTEILLTMILCFLAICKAQINVFPEGTTFANALYFRPN